MRRGAHIVEHRERKPGKLLSSCDKSEGRVIFVSLVACARTRVGGPALLRKFIQNPFSYDSLSCFPRERAARRWLAKAEGRFPRLEHSQRSAVFIDNGPRRSENRERERGEQPTYAICI